ncbi:hypothetical protein P7F88_25255 [Vibrio hannami]|uniref:hypothetical protein n=1 Tax=Vibrio hannami TaxID=2717094 RepID=UPI00240F43E1|nr:hypothetical protein [Vibrio hannami]MDG3089173.1 hypothetical protein [Vibrio hannami]
MLKPSSELQEYLIYVGLILSALVAKYIKSLKDDEPISPRRFLGETLFGFCLSQVIWFAGIARGESYPVVLVVGVLAALGLLYALKFFVQQINMIK